jgi:uncharacterized protein with von Willebrand factor type A (vWA) domain
MYPFATLPENLIAFSEFLRQRYAFRIGPRETQDAARALELIDLADERAARNVLRPVLSGSLRDATSFDAAFTEFFFPGPPGVPQSNLPRPGGTDADADRAENVVQQRQAADDREADESRETAADSIAPVETDDAETALPALTLRSSYSPLPTDTAKSPELTAVDAQWREAARSFVQRLHLGLTRRWRPSAKGRRFDLRRTLRASLQTGGEALSARWLRRPRRTPRVVLLIDGSRSMSQYAQTALQLAVAVATATLRVEVFTFSTALQRVTDDVRKAAAGEPRRLERLHHAWAGGTSIGACLADFLRRFGDRFVSRDTVVVIASDGLDLGAPDVLSDAMRALSRRSAGVLWLNPLLETPGYEPTACGMRAARPFIGTFACINDAASLARLSHIVRLRP